jgi:ABC-type dipeptide/oligopeptide/nickel transport system permease component
MGRSATDLLIFIGGRLLQLVPVLLGVVTITFYFTHIAISNPCVVWYPHAKQATINACINRYSLNQSILTQYWKYLLQLLTGDWGTSAQGVAVLPALTSAVPATIELVLAALFLMVFIGIPLGVIAAQSNGRWADHFVRVFYLSGWATPTYLGAVIAAIGIAPLLGVSGGEYSTYPPPFAQPTHFSILDALLAGNLGFAGDAVVHLALPAAVLAFINMGIATRMTRSSMLEVLPLDYVKAARMKGLTEFWVLYKHALRNSLITTTTVLGVTAGGLLSGTIVIEEVFRWPGIGAYAFDAITNYNFAGTIGVVIIFAIGVVIANMIADILYGVLDPKVEWR